MGIVYNLNEDTAISMPDHLINKVAINRTDTQISVLYSIPPCVVEIKGNNLYTVYRGIISAQAGYISAGSYVPVFGTESFRDKQSEPHISSVKVRKLDDTEEI